MKILNIVSGATLLCLLVLLTGCVKDAEIIRVPVETTVVEKVTVPANLLEPCPTPDLDTLNTTGDLERVALEALAAADCGNDDKEAIREWQAEEIEQ